MRYEISGLPKGKEDITEEKLIEILKKTYLKEVEEIIDTEIRLALNEGIRDISIMADWIEQSIGDINSSRIYSNIDRLL